jgi:deoxyribodipyrimidine photo-lyase
VNEILIQNNDKTESIFWFRRWLEDNIGLFHALESEYPVIPLFIYDDAILDSLPKMIRELDLFMNHYEYQLKQIGSSLLVKKGETALVFKALSQEFDIKVFFNKDYEQYAIARDHKICEFWRVKIFCFFL